VDFRAIHAEELPAAFAITDEQERETCTRQFACYPDLFVAGFEEGRMVGACYGWPVEHARERAQLMCLIAITLAPNLRGRGHGRELLTCWERQVARRGEWTVDVGTGFDAFYLGCGYTPVEFFVKVHKDHLPADFRARGHPIWFVRYEEDPLVVLYVKLAGEGHLEQREAMGRALGAESTGTIFRKHLPRAT
jgi:GNAT superfamily N-acetyltransferase